MARTSYKYLVLALILTLALACKSEAETTQLSFTTWQLIDGDLVEWWGGLIQEYEENHEAVDISVTDLARDSYSETLLSQFAAGSPPDIVQLASFEFPIFMEQGFLENLDSYISEANLPIDKWAGQSVLRKDGNNYGLMLLYFGFNLYYNQQLLQAAGISAPPQGWDEYYAAAKALTVDKDADGITDQYGVGFQTAPGPGQYLTGLLNFVLASGARWTDENGKPSINTPAMINAFGQWKALLQEKLTPRGSKINDIRQLFNEGKIAMLIEGPWMWGVSRNAAPDVLPEIKLALSPFSPPVGGSSNGLAMPASISQEKKDLVWDFINLAVSEPWQEKYIASGQTSPRPGVSIPAEAKQNVPDLDLIFAAMNQATQAKVDRLPLGLELVYNDFGRIVQDEMERMVQEDRDPAEVAAELQDKVLALQSGR